MEDSRCTYDKVGDGSCGVRRGGPRTPGALRERHADGAQRRPAAGPPPYRDNDFEAFVDVLGRGDYYKEFETNALNATYDINWGRADGAPLACSHAGGAGAGG